MEEILNAGEDVGRGDAADELHVAFVFLVGPVFFLLLGEAVQGVVDLQDDFKGADAADAFEPFVILLVEVEAKLVGQLLPR